MNFEEWYSTWKPPGWETAQWMRDAWDAATTAERNAFARVAVTHDEATEMVAAERESCAGLAESFLGPIDADVAGDIADAIRARGEQGEQEEEYGIIHRIPPQEFDSALLFQTQHPIHAAATRPASNVVMPPTLHEDLNPKEHEEPNGNQV